MDQNLLPERIQRFLERVLMDRIWDQYKLLFLNALIASFYTSAYRAFMSSMNATMIECVLYTIYYYLGTYDCAGGTLLLFLEFATTYMTYQLKVCWGTILLICLLLTSYPGYASFLKTQCIKIPLALIVKYFFVCDLPNISFAFYHCFIAYHLIFHGYPWSKEDCLLVPLYGNVLGSIIHKRYELTNVSLMTILLLEWMFVKCGRFQAQRTYMTPAPVIMFRED